jgi:hypothetical protein
MEKPGLNSSPGRMPVVDGTIHELRAQALKPKDDPLWMEYEMLVQVEQELNKSRYAVSGAYQSVGIVITGLALREAGDGSKVLLTLALALGFVFFLTGWCHYQVFHCKSHAMRERIIEVEAQLGVRVYSLRAVRPTIPGTRKELRFHRIHNVLLLAFFLFVATAIAGLQWPELTGSKLPSAPNSGIPE